MRHISIFSYLTVIDWNSLPSSVVLSNLVNCFMSRLSVAWKEHPLKFDLNFMLIVSGSVVP